MPKGPMSIALEAGTQSPAGHQSNAHRHSALRHKAVLQLARGQKQAGACQETGGEEACFRSCVRVRTRHARSPAASSGMHSCIVSEADGQSLVPLVIMGASAAV